MNEKLKAKGLPDFITSVDEVENSHPIRFFSHEQHLFSGGEKVSPGQEGVLNMEKVSEKIRKLRLNAGYDFL